MIVTFSVSNFRSIAEEQTLSLVASNRIVGYHEQHTEPIPGSEERVLRVAVMYGANGAGKSNVFRALDTMRDLLTEPRGKDAGVAREPFRFGHWPQEPTSFDLQFIIGEKLYRCGLVINDERILEEWLLRIDGGRESMMYERRVGVDDKLTTRLGGSLKSQKKLNALGTIGGPQNQSFLATIQATIDPGDYDGEIKEVIEWFTHGIGLISPDAPFKSLIDLVTNDEEFRNFAGEFLHLSSTGIHHLEAVKREVGESEVRMMVPESVVSDANAQLPMNSQAIIRSASKPGVDIVIERHPGKDRFYVRSTQAAHEQHDGSLLPLELDDESDGTQRLLHLLPALYDARQSEGTYFIDEIDRSLHPLLVWKFTEFFLRECSKARSQLIVTTHESNLLDLELLRRDEIWFAEKNPSGATSLYSLADFKIRKDLEVRKHYLQGRFGAIPFLSGLDRLVETESTENGK